MSTPYKVQTQAFTTLQRHSTETLQHYKRTVQTLHDVFTTVKGQVYALKSTYVRTWNDLHIHIYGCIYVCMCVCVYMHVCVHVCMYDQYNTSNSSRSYPNKTLNTMMKLKWCSSLLDVALTCDLTKRKKRYNKLWTRI